MAEPSYAVNGFLGGEISDFASGRFDRPDYKVSLNVCFNAFPVEIGAWVRRPGTQCAGATRGGGRGRVIKFDFQQTSAYTMEFTDGHLRFRSGANLVTNNDSQSVTSISTANPAVVTVAVSPASGATVMFANLGATCPLLQNRQFTWTHINGTTGSIADAITGANIDGSTLGVSGLAATATMSSINDMTTVYTGGSWSSLRSVQTEIAAFFLHQNFAPYELSVKALPTLSSYATFNLAQAFFEDGPYLDPIPGSTVTVGATSGITSLTLGFQPYSATQAYTNGAFVSSGGVGYQSIQDANVNNTPASSPTFWKVVSLGAAVNQGQGFTASDIGRLVRLFSEPALWSSTATYATHGMVSFNPSNIPGGETYYQSLTSSNVGNTPGTDTANWQLVAIGSTQNPALWSWGKITSLASTGAISGATGTNIGNMTHGGGLAAAFDGTTSKIFTNCAFVELTNTGYIGKNYGGQTISQVVVYPSSNCGYVSDIFGDFFPLIPVTINLRGKSTAPANSSDGTLLGTTGSFTNNLSPVTITSNDTTTSWNYVWIEAIGENFFDPVVGIVAGGVPCAAQVVFYSASAAPGTAVNVEILGPALLYSGVTIQTWRLGVYSNTTGWPNVGTYSDGRLWLSAPSFPNRLDASVANGINGVNNGSPIGSVNFAPTDQYGNVTDANGISYVLNSEGTNPVLWMQPTLQGIILETLAGEWLVTAPTAGGLSPLNISARKVTKIGGANVMPVTTEHTYVFVQRYSVKLMEYFSDVFSGKFTAPNLADKAQHITRAGIAEIAYTHSATPIIWGRDNAGALFGVTYKRDTLTTSQGPTFYAWHTHALGTGRTVESVCAGPSVGGNLDALTMVTSDGTTRHVEILTDVLDELSTLSQSWFLDDAINPSSTSSSNSSPSPYGGLTINGLWHLNGKTVSVFAGGLDCGDYTVASGSVTVPYGDGISAGTGGGLFTAAFAATATVVVGCTYNSDGQIVRPQEAGLIGTRLGPGLGKSRRVIRASALFSNLGMSNTAGQAAVSLGTSFPPPYPAVLNAGTTRNPASVPANALSAFSGVWMDAIKSEKDFDGMLCWRISRPLPCNIAAVQSFVNAEDGP